MKAYIILSSILLCAASAGAVTLTLTPGSLVGNGAEVPASDAEITVMGEINAKDLAALAAMRPKGAVPTTLDLSAATIVSTRYNNSNYLGYTYLPAAELPPYIFSGTSFAEVRMPESLTAIADGAFAGAALVKAEIPAAVVSIGDYAFYDCSALTDVSAGASLTSLGKGAFGNCRALRNVDFAKSRFTEIPERAFAGCAAVESIQIPADLDKVGAEAFAGTGITTLSLSSVRKLEPFALSDMPNLESATLDSGAQQGEGLFANDPFLRSINGAASSLPDAYAAGCTSLDASTLSSSATAIGSHALASTAAEELTLGPSLTSVSREAISGLAGLKTINAYALGSNVPYAEPGAFDGIEPSKVDLLVAEDDQPLWKADEQWSRFNIKADPSTSAENIGLSDAIAVTAGPDEIIIRADKPLTQVTVCQLDGKTIAALNPGTGICRIAAPAEQAVIIKATTADSTRTVKLLLR